MDGIDPTSSAGKVEASNEISRLRQSVAEVQAPEDGDLDWHKLAEMSGKLGDLLTEANRLPEAIQAYQEATDAYGNLPDAGEMAEHFARKVVAGVNELWKRPAERLDLLIAKLERQQRQVLTVGDSPMEAAEIAF